jgi:transcriptional regulator of nitric oxide reductase
VTFCLNNIGSLRFRQGDLQEAERCFEESLAIRREHPSQSDPLKELYISLLNLGIVRVRLGAYA